MSKQFKTALVLVFGVFLGVSASITGNVLANKEEAKGLPLDQLRNFSDIFSRIKSDYVEDVEDKVLLEHAIRGMLSGLDPHSTYLNPDEYNELRIGTSGEFGGLGIQVGMEDGFVKVISPIDDTPAYKAGLQAGDLIIRLDDKTVKGLTLNDAVKIMRGKPGTDIEPWCARARINLYRSLSLATLSKSKASRTGCSILDMATSASVTSSPERHLSCWKPSIA